MKNRIKQILAFVTVFLIFTTIVSVFACAKSEKTDDYKTGDIVIYGKYPQSKVEDRSLIKKLNDKAGSTSGWKSYDYYSGTGIVKETVTDEKTGKREEKIKDNTYDGKMVPGNYMRFTDIGLAGEKYRGVYFSYYRPEKTGDALVKEDFFRKDESDDKKKDKAKDAGKPTKSTTSQDDNGYNIDTVYWFKYEPVQWRVLDPNTGFVMCNSIIDSQAYNNYIFKFNKFSKPKNESDLEKYDVFFNNPGGKEKKYTTDYSTSSIREWLNNEFYNDAFDSKQQGNIKSVTLDNECRCSKAESKKWKVESKKTKDKVFLLSKDDISNENYRLKSIFFGDEKVRLLFGSDYAKCQGLRVNYSLENFLFTIEAYKNPITDENSSHWWIRMPTVSSHIHYVGYDGFFTASGEIENTSFTSVGVVPAMVLKDLSKTDRPDKTEIQNIFMNETLAKDNGKPVFITLIVVAVIIAVIILCCVLHYLKKIRKQHTDIC